MSTAAGEGTHPHATGPDRRTGAAQLAVRLAGGLLLLIPFVPTRALFGETPGSGWLLSPPEWLLALFIFGAAAWLAALLLPRPLDGVRDRIGRLAEAPGDRTFLVAALAGLLLLLFVTSTFAFARRPLLLDSIVQLFQARIFASGHLVAPAPPDEAFFAAQHMIVDGNRWYSQYPPGHPAALALGVLAGAPWLVPLLLSTGSAWLLFAFTRRVFDRRTARLTLGLALLSPFFWFMGASHMNHVTTLFFVSLFLFLFARWDEGAGGGWLAAAGLALGGAFLSRPLTALAVGAAFAVIVLPQLRSRLGQLLAGAAGFAACVGLFLAYNARTTGDPLVPGYVKLWGANHGLGFHLTPWGDLHTPAIGLQSQLVDLGLLNSFLFEWPVPALLPLGLFLAAGWADRRWDHRLLLGFAALPVAHFFYWHRDAFLGPRFLYAGLVFLLPLTSRAILGMYDRWRDRLLSQRIALARIKGGALLTALLLLCFGYSLFYSTPQRFRVYRTGMASLKVDLVREAERAGIERGLVFVAVAWGNRLLARTRAAGVPASVAERVYRRSDHCELEEAMRRAEAEGWDGPRLVAALEALVRPESELVRPQLNGDLTLRLRPDAALTPACLEELRYDGAAFTYTNYTPHLAQNRPDLGGRFVFARDLRGRNVRLRAAFPDRPAYLYRPGKFEPLD